MYKILLLASSVFAFSCSPIDESHKKIQKIIDYSRIGYNINYDYQKFFGRIYGWSEENLRTALKTNFTKSELEEIFQFYEDMGGENYNKKRILLANVLMKIMKNLDVQHVELNISESFDSMIENELESDGIVPLLKKSYRMKNKPNINYKDNLNKFIERSKRQLKKIVSLHYTEDEYRKEQNFLRSSLGVKLSKTTDDLYCQLYRKKNENFYTKRVKINKFLKLAEDNKTP